MTTAKDVFDIAMSLMDEVNGATGATETADTREYKNRTLLILTALRGELYPFSDTYPEAEAGKRPVCGTIDDFNSPIGIDDVLCQTVLPYGLAAHLLLDENPAVASFFIQRYAELLTQLSRRLPTGAGSIENLYGAIEHGEYGYWG